MQITPLDIRKHPFRKTFKGFDPDQVNSFLNMVADEYEKLIRSSNELATQLKSCEQKPMNTWMRHCLMSRASTMKARTGLVLSLSTR